jgi:hypothetical protein
MPSLRSTAGASGRSKEPVLERDLAMMGQLWSIGIRKGQTFKPAGEVAEALKQAVKTGHDILQDRFVSPGGHELKGVPGTWEIFRLDE